MRLPASRRLAQLSLTVALVLSAIAVGTAMWPYASGRSADLDIRTGRIRLRCYLFDFKIWERVVDSAVTRALPADVRDGTEPDWRRVTTYTPGRKDSPHHAYHSAVYLIRRLESLWGSCDFTPDAKAKAAQDMLSLLQSSQGDFAAQRYLYRVEKLASSRRSGGQRIDAHNLDGLAPERR